MRRGRLLLAVALADVLVLVAAAGTAVHRAGSASSPPPVAALPIPLASKAPGDLAATGEAGQGVEATQALPPGVTPGGAVLTADGPSVPGPPAPVTADATRYDHVSGLAARDGIMVAVGERLSTGKDPNPQASEPRAWWSSDAGATWMPAPVPGRGSLHAVVADGDRFIAAGTRVRPEGFFSLVLTSDDGRAWREEPVAYPDVVLLAAVASHGGPILAGSTVRLGGNRPFALVPDGGRGWTAARPEAGLNGAGGELRGLCADDRTVVAVGTASNAPDRSRPHVIQSSDWGVTWNAVTLRGAPAIGSDTTANACAFAAGRLAVVGRATTRENADRGYVSIREDGVWRDARVLAPSLDTPLTHTLVRAVTAAGPDFLIAGYDTSEDGGGDAAFWLGGRTDGPFARLPALEEHGEQRGRGEARAVLFRQGLVVAAGTSAHQAVVWRSSLDAAQRQAATAKPADPELAPWRLASFDVCTLLDAQSLTAVGGQPPRKTELRTHEFSSTCIWYMLSGGLFILEVSPAIGFDVVRSTYSKSFASPEAIAGLCDEAAYFPTNLTVAARCGDTALVLRTVTREHAPALIREAASRIPPAKAA